MICPGCGEQMNHHADKVDYSAAVNEQPDDDLGGVVKEVHTCPRCGNIEMRRGQR